MKISGIYKIQSVIKPNRIYIGSASDLERRWDAHLRLLRRNLHHSNRLQNHFNKYGENDILFAILEHVDINLLINKEQHYIDTVNPWFNIAKIAGSTRNVPRSDKTKMLISKSLIGNKRSVGRVHTEETKQKMRGPRGKFDEKRSLENKKRRKLMDGPMLNKRHSIETKQKMKEKRLLYLSSHPISEETKIKMRKPKSENAKEKMRKSAKGGNNKRRVINIISGIIYNSIKEAAFLNNINKSTLFRKISGYTKNNTNLKYYNE